MNLRLPTGVSRTIDSVILLGAAALALIGGLYFLAEEHYLQSKADAAPRGSGQSDVSVLQTGRELVIRLRELPQLAGAVPSLALVKSSAGAILIPFGRDGRTVALAVAYGGRTANTAVSFKDQHHASLASHPVGSGAAVVLLADNTRQVRVYVDGTFAEEITLSDLINAPR